MTNLSSLYRLAGPIEKAAAFHDRSEAALQQLLDADPADRSAATTLAAGRVNWTYVLLNEGRHAEALGRLARTLPPLERLHRLEPADALVRDALYRVHGVRGQVYEGLGRYADAVADGERMIGYAPPAARRFHGWFVARNRALAGDAAGALRDLDGLLPQVGPGVPAAEPLHGAETAARAAARLRALAAVAGGAAADADRADGLTVRLLAAAKAASDPAEWLTTALGAAADPLYRPLHGRADYRGVMGGK